MEFDSLIKKNKINALCNFDLDFASFQDSIVQLQDFYPRVSVQKYILEKTNCTEERLLSSFSFVNLSKDKLKQKINTLSSSEKIKVELAILFILNKDVLVLYQFDKYFMEKEIFFFKKLLKKLVSRYHKTIVCVDTSCSFMLDFVERYVVLTEHNGIKVLGKDDVFSPFFERYIGSAPIVKFVKYVNKNQQRIKPYTDIKELIKEIYREV